METGSFIDKLNFYNKAIEEKNNINNIKIDESRKYKKKKDKVIQGIVYGQLYKYVVKQEETKVMKLVNKFEKMKND